MSNVLSPPHTVSFQTIRTGSGILGLRRCCCPSPFPTPSIHVYRCFSIHSSLPAIEFHSRFFFTTDVAAPIRSTMGGDLEGTGGTAPLKFEVGGRPMHPSSPIFREVLLCDVRQSTN